MVDGQEGPSSLAKTTRLYEVQKYCSLTSHIWDGWYVLINPRAFKKLPKDMADLVMDSYNQAAVDERKDMVDLNEAARTFMKEKGMAFNTPPDLAPFRKKLSDAGFYKEWKDKMGAEAWSLLEEVSGPLV